MNAVRSLSPSQVRFFHEEGYMIVPDVFDRTQPSFAEVRQWPPLPAGSR